MFEKQYYERYIEYFKKLNDIKNKTSFKCVINTVLSDLGYKEIVDNEVIIQYLTVQYGQDNGDSLDYSLEFVMHHRDDEIEKIEKYIYDRMYNYISSRFNYYCDGYKAIFESKAMNVEMNGNHFKEKYFSDNDYLAYIKSLFEYRSGSLEINRKTFEYDINLKTTSYIEELFKFSKRRDYSDERQHAFSFFSEITSDIYDDKNYMIDDIKIIKSNSFMSDMNVSSINSLDKYIASKDNYKVYKEFKKISNDRAKVIIKENYGKLISKDFGGPIEYENEIPLVYANSDINYFSGFMTYDNCENDDCIYEYDDFEDFDDLDKYDDFEDNLYFEIMGQDKEYFTNLADKYPDLKELIIRKDDSAILSRIYQFSISKMVGKEERVFESNKLMGKYYSKETN